MLDRFANLFPPETDPWESGFARNQHRKTFWMKACVWKVVRPSIKYVNLVLGFHSKFYQGIILTWGKHLMARSTEISSQNYGVFWRKMDSRHITKRGKKSCMEKWQTRCQRCKHMVLVSLFGFCDSQGSGSDMWEGIEEESSSSE